MTTTICPTCKTVFSANVPACRECGEDLTNIALQSKTDAKKKLLRGNNE